jgi:hypothetical protein
MADPGRCGELGGTATVTAQGPTVGTTRRGTGDSYLATSGDLTWPPAGTSTWPLAGTLSWPRTTGVALLLGAPDWTRGLAVAVTGFSLLVRLWPFRSAPHQESRCRRPPRSAPGLTLAGSLPMEGPAHDLAWRADGPSEGSCQVAPAGMNRHLRVLPRRQLAGRVRLPVAVTLALAFGSRLVAGDRRAGDVGRGHAQRERRQRGGHRPCDFSSLSTSSLPSRALGCSRR